MIETARQTKRVCLRNAGFTLVELMVVVGIIALLVAIVVPAVNSARISAKSAGSKATISIIDQGLEQYRIDGRVGGDYPPSRISSVATPHDASGSIIVGGASLVTWALVGADLLGSPGFRDLNLNGDWADDTGQTVRGNPANGFVGSDLYAIYPAAAGAAKAGKPIISRSGPFVPVSKMSFATPADPNDTNGNFRLDKLPSKPYMTSNAFLDGFGQPILYYRANPSGSLFASEDYPTGINPTSRYYLNDNANITGNSGGSNNGLDFGAGTLNAPYANKHHYLSLLGDISNPGTNVLSFSRTIWNPNVNVAGGGASVLRPHNTETFILLSAGPDGRFGSADDVANFEVNK